MNEREIFIQALPIADPSEQAAFLDRACGPDQPLRQQVADLLAAHARAQSFLEVPPSAIAREPGPTTAGTAAERPGTQIGPYKLLEQIGEGGMGTVFVAQQSEPLKRLVALKIIKAGMDSRQVIARFEAERQALALMDHPNIAKVLDAGTTAAGRPYFVMELVKGVPITQYCDQHHLPPKERLELFVPVCQAIQHAHQKGIIHRDLKPSNVLVALYDDRPVPKIIDFGVAKATGQQLTEQTLHTGFGTVVGTLEYMSPEQATFNQLDVDTRSDVYSLGILLYELLAGSPPFTRKELERAGMLEMLRVIREEEPSKPSIRLSSSDALPTLSANRGTEPAKLTKLVCGELDWIVMKALEKDRSRRYETASSLASDVERYLEDEPVQAGPPSRWYRFRKFARRNKRSLAMTAVLGLALLVATGAVAGSLGWMARDKSVRQAILNSKVERALQEASRARELALTLTDDPYQWDAAVAAADSAVKSAAWIATQDEAALSPGLKHELRSLQTAMEADQRDRRFIDRFEAIRLEPSELNNVWRNFKFANAYPAIGQALDDSYHLRIGTTPIDEAKRAVLERPLPIQQYLLTTLEAALMYAPPGDAAAQDWLKNVVASVDPAPWRQRARQAVDAEDWQALESIVSERAAARQPAADLLRYAERVPVKSTSKLAMLRLIRRTYPADFWANHQLATALHQSQPQQLDEAIRYHTAAVALRPKSAAAAANLASILRIRGFHEQALAAYQDLLLLDPDNALAHVGIGWTLSNQNRLDEALAAMHKAIELRPAMPTGYDGLSSVLVKQKRFPEAMAMAREAVRLGPKDPYCHKGLGNLLLRQGLPVEAESEYLKAIELNPNLAAFREHLGRALEAQQRFKDAEQAYLDAIRLDPSVAAYRDSLRRAREAQQKFKAAGTGLTPTAEGFTPLFSGKDLTGWDATGGAKQWRVEDGALTCSGPQAHLLTVRNDFSDFHLRAEVKINAGGNSGVYFRASKPLVLIGDYEAQISDNPGQKYKTGSLFGLVRVSESPVPPETWFTYEIIAVGNGIRILVNGQQTADYTEDRADRNTQGHIALQHLDPETRVFFRKVEIKELSPGKSVANGAFVLLGGKAVAERTFDSLAAAVDAASGRGTIEIRGNGPFVTRPILIDRQSLTIRAGEGFSPVIRADPEEQGDSLLNSQDLLVLEGLDLEWVKATPGGPARWLVVSKGPTARLHAVNCRFLMNRRQLPHNMGCIGAWDSALCHLRNCQLLVSGQGSFYPVFNIKGGPDSTLIVENCLVGQEAFLTVTHAKPMKAVLNHNTFLGQRFMTVRHYNTVDLAGGTKGSAPLEIVSTANIFGGPLMFCQMQEFLKSEMEFGGKEGEQSLKQLVGWRDHGNLYSSPEGSELLRLWLEKSPTDRPKLHLTAPITTLADWKDFWGMEKLDSLRGQARFQGGVLITKAPELLTPQHFRLSEGSPGHRAGPDGKDLGADVDLVGPGEAYKRWKKTPEYEEWLKQTGQKE